jgi:RNA polymerase primary sigma factor
MRNLQITQSITNRSSLVELYFNDISKEKMCTSEDEVILAQQIKQGDRAAMDKLVKSNLRFVVSVAKKYQFQGLPLADLINEGNLGLMKAAERFDETRGFKFISFAVWWIRQSIMAAITQNARMVRLPLNRINDISKMNKAIFTLEQQTMRQPTAEQLADHLDMNPEKVTHALQQAKWTTSIDTVYGEEEYCWLDTISCNDYMPDETLMAESHAMELESMLAKLTGRERLVIELTYGLTGQTEMSPADIAQVLNLSTERVRQIWNIALEKLRNLKPLL